MKLNKIISKSLTIGLLFNSISTSFASTISEDGRYETFEGNNITIDNILEEDKVDIEIEGNTLVNLWKRFSHVNSNGWLEGKLQYEDIQGDITICNFSSKEILFQLSYNDSTNAENSYYSRSVSVMPGKKIKVNVLPNEKFRMIQGRYEHGWSNTEEDIEEFNSSLVVIKGDYLEEDIKYFGGMKSVGELENNELYIVSTSSNIFDIAGFTITQGVRSSGYLNEINIGNFDKFYWKPCDKDGNILPYSSNYVLRLFKNSISQENEIGSVVSRSDLYIDLSQYKNQTLYCDFYYNGKNLGLNDGDIYEVNKIMISNKPINSYFPHITEKKEINISEPLRGLSNGLRDKIIKKNGQWCIVRNYKEIELNGDEDWIYEHSVSYEDTTSLYIFKISDLYLPDDNYSITTINDKLPNINRHDLWYQTKEGVSNMRKNGEYSAIGIRIKTSEAPDLISFKTWLSKNPITVVYQLKEPVYEPLNIDLHLNTYLDTIYISNNSIIPANMKITVDRAINRATEAIEIAKTNPTIANISQARMWSNLLKETINKDVLQDEINSITNIEDLQLERKTVTSNIDVYIKSENMLLMSLSTNSITFNDYSGVYDMTLDNAINISINSSLPYQLNSYLLTEIENSDKSNRIEKDLLNIKSSSDTVYKTFNDIDEKLVLENDCVSGNNKSHSIDLMLKGSQAHTADVYKTVIKFEAEQK